MAKNTKIINNTMGTQKVKVEGMTCNHCKMSVEKALKETGFGEVNVNLEDKSVEFDLSGKTLEQAVAAIEAKGYDVEV